MPKNFVKQDAINEKLLLSIPKSPISEKHKKSITAFAKTMPVFLLLVLLLLVLLLPVELNGTTAVDDGSSRKFSDHRVFRQISRIGKDKKDRKDKNAWTGKYSFEDIAGWRERGPGGAVPVVSYSITVSKRKGRLIAALEADGFQTAESYACTVDLKSNRLNLYYQSGGSGFDKANSLGLKKGQLLLSLVEKISGKNTRYAFYPAAYEIHTFGKKRRKIYFSKT